MNDSTPTFPPLLEGHAVPAGEHPFEWARQRAQQGDLGAGDLAWSADAGWLRFALVLEPDVVRERCGEILFAVMVAFGDAAGALIPPEVAITYRWPNHLLMNNGQIGAADLILSNRDADDAPLWMVVALEVQMMPDFADMNPGANVDVTTMWDEGCGEMSPVQLLESVSRHILNAIHNWSEDGFQPIHEQWSGRHCKAKKLVDGVALEGDVFVGLDETGNALISRGAKTVSLSLQSALNSAPLSGR